MLPATAGTALGIDSRSLDGLRGEAARNPKAAARQAAVQFESMFMQMVLKSMRDATIKADSMSGDAGGGGSETFTSMLDTQMAKQFAGRPQGLADMIERQLSRHIQNMPTVSSAHPAPAAGPITGPAAPLAAIPSTALPGAVPSTPQPTAAGGTTPQAAFLQRLMPHARAAERETGVAASFILGQAALESGWGKAELRNADGSQSFNLFGVKAAAGWKGATTEAMTTEYEGGQAVKQLARFRSYGSYTEAFADYARMLATSPRYSAVVRSADSAENFAGGMQRAGYATDPHYASKLARTINHALALQRAQG